MNLAQIYEKIEKISEAERALADEVRKTIPYKLICLLGNLNQMLVSSSGISFTDSGDFMSKRDMELLRDALIELFPLPAVEIDDGLGNSPKPALDAFDKLMAEEDAMTEVEVDDGLDDIDAILEDTKDIIDEDNT